MSWKLFPISFWSGLILLKHLVFSFIDKLYLSSFLLMFIYVGTNIINSAILNIFVYMSYSFCTFSCKMRKLVYLYCLLPSFIFFSQHLLFMILSDTGFIVFTLFFIIITSCSNPSLIFKQTWCLLSVFLPLFLCSLHSWLKLVL